MPTLEALLDQYPQYHLTIDKMVKNGRSNEEIEDHLISLGEMDDA
jgi:hypothetical protein